MTLAHNPGLMAAVPGQSLTMAPGSMPMEKPPQFVDPREAAEYFWKKLNTPKSIIKIVVLLRKGVPCEYIARTLLFTAISQGILSIDCALITARLVVKQIAAIGHLKGIKNMVIKNPDKDLINFASQNKEHMYDTDSEPDTDTSTGITKGLLGTKGTK